MDFALLPEEKKQELAKLMLTPLDSAQEIKDWAKAFLDLELPTENTDPASTSNPLDAAWYVYETFKFNIGNKRPGAIMISCREGLKTIIVTILELLLLIHFQLEVGHAAAIESQSSIALGYIEGFLFKIGPLLEAAGWIPHSSNKRVVKFKTPQGKSPYIKIVICTAKGMNGLHSNVLFLDELDLADKAALKEGKNITGFSKGIHGMQVFVSSYKYSFGNVAEALEKADDMNYKVLKWNLLDLAEKCPSERHLPNGPKQDMWINNDLPLRKYTTEEYSLLPDLEKNKLELVKDAHEGCVKCPLLPLCKKRLADKPDHATGGFYKPLSSVIQKFKENDPDMAESQLLCRRPGSEGLVYPKFSKSGNTISNEDAYEIITGSRSRYSVVTDAALLYAMQNAGIEFYAGVDWGFDHPFVVLIVAKIPNGQWWLMETYTCSELDVDDIIETTKTFRDKYSPIKWWCDTSRPDYMKAMVKNGMRCPDFKKEVLHGISAVKSKITNSMNFRALKVVLNESNKKTIEAIPKHRYELDNQGNVTPNPADEPVIADICDALRYIGQNMWSVKGAYKPAVEFTSDPGKVGMPKPGSHNVNEQMKNEIAKRLSGNSVYIGTSKKKGGFHFSQ